MGASCFLRHLTLTGASSDWLSSGQGRSSWFEQRTELSRVRVELSDHIYLSLFHVVIYMCSCRQLAIKNNKINFNDFYSTIFDAISATHRSTIAKVGIHVSCMLLIMVSWAIALDRAAWCSNQHDKNWTKFISLAARAIYNQSRSIVITLDWFNTRASMFRLMYKKLINFLFSTWMKYRLSEKISFLTYWWWENSQKVWIKT